MGREGGREIWWEKFRGRKTMSRGSVRVRRGMEKERGRREKKARGEGERRKERGGSIRIGMRRV